MAGYLEAVQVAVGDPSQRAETRRLVEQFLRPDGIGPKFQELLVEKQSKEDNWVCRCYLYSRLGWKKLMIRKTLGLPLVDGRHVLG